MPRDRESRRSAAGNRLRRVLRFVLLVVVFWIVLPLGLAEVLLRGIESRFLTVRRLEPGETHFDLADLGYNQDRPLPADRDDRFRILSFGDSFAFGIVQPPFTYAAVLEHDLAERTGREIEVVNLGRPGASFVNYLHELETWTSLVEYDAILVNVFSGNDFLEASLNTRPQGVSRIGPVAVTELPGPATRIPRMFALRLADYGYALLQLRLQATQRDADDVYRTLSEYDPDKYLAIMGEQVDVVRPDRFQRLKKSYVILHQLMLRLAELERQGTKVLVAVSPPDFAVDADLRREVLAAADLREEDLDLQLPVAVVRAIARHAGLGAPVLDLRPALVEAQSRGTDVYFSRNTHWSLEGNAVVGRELADEVARVWFDGETGTPAVDSADPAGLTSWLADLLETPDSAIPLEPRLRARAFASRQELNAWLRDHGYRRDRKLAGTIQSGIEVPAGHWLNGWAWDPELSGPLDVAAFDRGALIASGPTRFPAGPKLVDKLEKQGLRPAPDDVPAGLLISSSRPCRELAGGRDGTWAVALTRDRRFEFLWVNPQLPCAGMVR